jgi:hypothetical protein
MADHREKMLDRPWIRPLEMETTECWKVFFITPLEIILLRFHESWIQDDSSDVGMGQNQ